mgnify:FL=1
MADQRSQELSERIESKIDKDIGGAISIAGTGGAISLAPKNMGELMEFAKMMALSGTFVRKHLRNNPGACLAVSLQAMRWGMDPIAVGNKSFEVNDQIGYESQLVHAVVNERAPLQGRLRSTYSGEGENRRCVIAGKLTGEDVPLEYETPPIGRINPKNSPLWKNDPDQQLFYFAVRSWARRHVPEVLLGVYTDDEVDHIGADRAKDVTPAARPSRHDVETEEPEDVYTLIDAHGEIHGNFTRDGFVDEVMNEINNCVQPDILQAFWEFNEDAISSLGSARDDADRQRINRAYNAAREAFSSRKC